MKPFLYRGTPRNWRWKHVWNRDAGVDGHSRHCPDYLGPGKLPELGSTIGKAIRGFKKAIDEPEEKSGETSEARKIENRKE